MSTPPLSGPWQILQARDRTLIATKKTYATWVANLEQRLRSSQEHFEQQLSSSNQYWEQQLAATKDSLDNQLAGTKEYLAKVEDDRDTKFAAIGEMEKIIAQTNAYLKSVEDDRQNRLEKIQAQQRDLDQQGKELHTAQAELRQTKMALQGTQDYLKIVEKDRQDRLESILSYQKDLQAKNMELSSKQAECASLAEEVSNLQEAVAVKNRIIENFRPNERDDTESAVNSWVAQSVALHRAFAAYGRHFKKVIVAKYHERLLPQILQLSSLGATVEVFDCPPTLSRDYQGSLHFVTDTLWDWLGVLDSLFNENAYLAANPDVAAAVSAGQLATGREHFLLFGQQERRSLGTPYFSGISEFDAVLFDQSDWNSITGCLAARMLPHQQIIISGHDPAKNVLPEGGSPKYIGGGLLIFHRPPRLWLGWPTPLSSRLDSGWPHLRRKDLYPSLAFEGQMWPKITVVTVSYNQGGYLEETLRSVLDQHYPNLEYIVVDGGSSDGSVDIIRQYAPQLSWWTSEKDGGQSEALNKGFRRATGEILTWVNSDDRLAPASLFAVADTYLRYKADVVVGRCARLWNRDVRPHHFHRSSLPLGQVVPLPLDQLLNLDDCWLKGHFFHQPEVFFTKEIFDRAGGALREDLYYSMDYDLWVRLAQAGATVVAIPEIIALFRMHDQQKTGGDNLPYLPELRTLNAAFKETVSSAEITKNRTP